jgi:hypothetical protein
MWTIRVGVVGRAALRWVSVAGDHGGRRIISTGRQSECRGRAREQGHRDGGHEPDGPPPRPARLDTSGARQVVGDGTVERASGKRSQAPDHITLIHAHYIVAPLRKDMAH